VFSNPELDAGALSGSGTRRQPKRPFQASLYAMHGLYTGPKVPAAWV
jgi:hypothetical protein